MAFYILLILFVVVPVAEISLLIEIGSDIGLANTLLIVIFTAILGAYLVRQQGFATLANVQNEMNAGRVPAMQMAEGVALLFAGAVLLTPGFMTDAFGFALLIPPVRRSLIAWIASKGILHTQQAPGKSPKSPGPSVIEGEYKERE